MLFRANAGKHAGTFWSPSSRGLGRRLASLPHDVVIVHSPLTKKHAAVDAFARAGSPGLRLSGLCRTEDEQEVIRLV